MLIALWLTFVSLSCSLLDKLYSWSAERRKCRAQSPLLVLGTAGTAWLRATALPFLHGQLPPEDMYGGIFRAGRFDTSSVRREAGTQVLLSPCLPELDISLLPLACMSDHTYHIGFLSPEHQLDAQEQRIYQLQTKQRERRGRQTWSRNAAGSSSSARTWMPATSRRRKLRSREGRFSSKQQKREGKEGERTVGARMDFPNTKL
ncbi:uncharacterized protein [Apteryx mantelli]